MNKIAILTIVMFFSMGSISCTAQEQNSSLPTVEELIQKVEQNVEKIHDLKATVKETEQEMNISETKFSVKKILSTVEYTFLFKKPDMFKIIPKKTPNTIKTKEELDEIYKQHPEWTEAQQLKYYSENYLSPNVDSIRIGQAEYYVDTGTKKLTDKFLEMNPMAYMPWKSLLEPSQLHLFHNQLRKLLEPFIMQNSLTVRRDGENPDVYVVEGSYKGPSLDKIEKTSPYGWDYDVWSPGEGNIEINIKVDYKQGIIVKSGIYYTQDFTKIGEILVPIKFTHFELRQDTEKEKKFVQTLIEFSNVEINKGISDEEFLFDNTNDYDISRYRIKLLNEK